MRRFICFVGLSAFLGGGGLFVAPPLSAQSALNVRMQKVLGKFVETTGDPIMGVGSWISGKAFNAATSDFDMRLVLSKSGTPAQNLARWQQSRNQMISLIKAEFGDQAGNVLSRTNLYAPNQLMAGVENTADAMERFQRLKTVPSLAHTGPVTPATTAKYAEGLYGSGAQTYVQGYERGAGRLFYNNNGKAVTGLSELAHMGEGAPTYTAAGTANTAGQWAAHGVEEMAAGRGDKVAKYLGRLERDWVKSRSLSQLPIDDGFRNQLKNMRELLSKSPEKLGAVSDDVARLLARGKAEAAVLQGFENAGPVRRAYLRVMLDGVAAKNKVGELVNKVLKATPEWVNAQSAMNFIVFAVGTHATAQAAGRGNMMETLGTACEHLKWMKAFGPLFMAEMTAAIIEEAKASGYIAAAGSQEAFDLMEGVYSAWGRADVDPDKRRKLTLADMVANFQDERKLEAIVMAQAIRASTRGLGAATEESDMGVANAIFEKCWPVIRNAWRWERDTLTYEYLVLGSEIVKTPLVITYKPTTVKPGQRVICEAGTIGGKLGDRIDRMQQIIRILYGKGSLVSYNYYWEPGGSSVSDLGWQRGFVFEEPGKYPVKVRLEVAPLTRFAKTEPRVMLRRTVPAMVEVEVGDGPAQPAKDICPVCGRPSTEPPGRPNNLECTLYHHVIIRP